MSIKYLNFLGSEISQIQALNSKEYTKVTEVNGSPKRKEYLANGNVYFIQYYKDPGETEQQIVNLLIGEGKKFSIIERQTVLGNYQLEKSRIFSVAGQLVAMSNELYDPYGKQVATETIDNVSAGVPDYVYTKKYYFDPSINPETFLFESYFNEDGSFDKIYYNSLHTHPDEQDSEVLTDDPQDVQRLRDLTGISQQLADYYLVANVIP
jgi:hypothetical protein